MKQKVVYQFETIQIYQKRAVRRPPLQGVCSGNGQFVVQPSSVRRAAGSMYS